MSVKYLSSEAKEGGVASLRVSSSFYVAPRDAEPLSASDDDEDVEFLPSLTPITRVMRPQPAPPGRARRVLPAFLQK